MARAVLIKPDNSREIVDPKTVEDYQQLVGGYFECIDLVDMMVYLNEYGNKDQLPVNPMGTRFVKKKLRESGRTLLTESGWVLGNVLVIGMTNDSGNTKALPKKVAEQIITETI